MKNILIIGHSNIGDACYDMAVVNPLRGHFSQAKIHFLTSSRCKDVADGYKGIDHIITYDRSDKDKGFFRQIKFVSELRNIKFDIAVVLKKSARYVFLRADKIWCADKGRLRNLHPVESYLNLLRDKGINADSARFDFAVAEDERAYCERFFNDNGISRSDNIIGIMPLAAWYLKSWPIDKWNELAKILTHQFKFKVIALGKKDDNDVSSRVSAAISGDIIVAGQTTLKQAMALISRCKVFIGPDSSLIHIASCMGIKTIGLYGPTSTSCFYPYFHRDNIVLPAKKLPCMPCCPGKKVSCNKGKEKPDFGPCMENITVQDVLTRI